jgi:hypothetical protein
LTKDLFYNMNIWSWDLIHLIQFEAWTQTYRKRINLSSGSFIESLINIFFYIALFINILIPIHTWNKTLSIWKTKKKITNEKRHHSLEKVILVIFAFPINYQPPSSSSNPKPHFLPLHLSFHFQGFSISSNFFNFPFFLSISSYIIEFIVES